MKTISREAESAIEIKRSRFIGRSFKCSAPEEALAAVKRVRETWRDATHHLGLSSRRVGRPARYDNGGEPQGMAGPPILDVRKHGDLTNTLVVVTRYYGGTKLGAGGLVRAYGEAAKQAIEGSGVTEMRLVRELRAPVPYASLAPLEAYLGHEGFEIASKDFGELVTLVLRIPAEREVDFRAFYTGLVAGKWPISSWREISDREQKGGK
jgi:uncharacterized YigZ family protein